MKRLAAAVITVFLLSSPHAVFAKKDKEGTEPEKKEPMSSSTFEGLKLRSVGPAIASGRVSDLAVEPGRRSHYWVAVASGGVWKTDNAGTTWKPVFDGEDSYSIGCLAMDPRNPSVVWVGTGENNSQRSVSFGDGVYKTVDGGSSWQRMGLSESEHIGMIVIDPRDSNVVYVAAQGPLWRSGGDRGLYKTSDGGTTWERILHVSDDTGISEVHMDPRDPDVLYASAYQRRRRVWTLINGGPESGIHKSTDGGATWRELESGLPEVDKGRIGLDVSPADPDVVYAIVEAARDKSGFFRSTDRGHTWSERSDTQTTSPQYYNEIVCDPSDVDRVYLMDTRLRVTEDGGKSFEPVGERFKHVDNHALWIDPEDTNYLLVGCDGGVYESFDRGATWDYMANLPIMQFYRVAVDTSLPFYYIYGGTQDNATLGGPHRTVRVDGIANEDWFVTVGGDGFETRIDPEDPNIVYSQWQYGGLVRYDRASRETVDIKPREAPGTEPYRWNWDSPLIISPHSHTRLYFASQRLFRSDDRGDSWTVLTGDLSRGIDRNALPVMGKVWGADAVSKNASTSAYGNAVALTESPLVEGLIWVGTDDGLIHVTGDGGATWGTIEDIPGIPDNSFVSSLVASRHDPDTMYAAFDNHKSGDFAPYVVRITERGGSWTSITGDLPERHIVWSVAEDHETPGLLFAGTEFGVFFTVDGGQHWIELEGGMPTIAVRDIDIQRRENDLVLGTFGRGFYVLDDYSPLRTVSAEVLEREAVLFPVRDAVSYIQARARKGSRGDAFYTAPNPPYGAVFTYYLKDKITTLQERRLEAEKEADEAGTTLPYPTFEVLRAEDEEHDPQVVLTVRDDSGEVVRRITGSRKAGVHRVAWDLRYPSPQPATLSKPEQRVPWQLSPAGPRALPGRYTVTAFKVEDGVVTELAGPEEFRVIPLELATLGAADPDAVLAFSSKAARLQRAVRGALAVADEVENRVALIKKALLDTPGADVAMLVELGRIERDLSDILVELRGDSSRARRHEPTPPSISVRVGLVVRGVWSTTSAPTQTQLDGYRFAGQAFAGVLERLRTLVEDRLEPLESAVEAAGGPWTPGRIPQWENE